MGDSGVAIVKAVLSGDTLVLMGRPQNGPPPERQLSLSSLMAPKVARGPQSPEEVGTHQWRHLHMAFVRRARLPCAARGAGHNDRERHHHTT
jgi:hypothetical protein